MNGVKLTPIQRQALVFRMQERAKELVKAKFDHGVPFLKDYDIGPKHCEYLNMQEKMTLLENILIEGMAEGCKVLQSLRDEINQ